MNLPLKTAVAAIALISAAPAFADIIDARSSEEQGTLVHSDGEESGTDVTGTLGTGPKEYQYVHFQGTTDAPAPDDDVLHIQGGNGQAQVDGIEMGGNDNANLISGDIFLNSSPSGSGDPTDYTTNLGMEWIELAFEKGDLFEDADPSTDLLITFTLFALDSLGNPEDPTLSTFEYALDPNGENKFAFLATNGETIYDLHYSISGGVANALRQVRIASIEGGVPPVPEPATWAMMLVGFGAVGYSMRRRRKTYLAQVA